MLKQFSLQLGKAVVAVRDVEAVVFQSLPLPLTKNEITTVDNVFNFCGSVACLLLHFIISKRKKFSFIDITLPTSLDLIVPNYSVFLFLMHPIRTRVECRTELYKPFVIADPLMYFRVCYGNPH